MVGALVGGVTGLIGAYLVLGVVERLDLGAQDFVHAVLIVFLVYIGMVIGAHRGEWFEPARIIAAFKDASRLHQYKILDTSVIIDGRIADICETGFLEGTLVAPQFVLRELQQVADSSDSLKRNRGRRGLDVLQRIQKMPHMQVQIVETDFPEVREVDLKLIELARHMSGKIVTNDFNLNKVAQLRGVAVLNINELANSLKPVVLPGEVLRVFILKEGKEAGQGVAYLDDGTMVVVDQGKRALGKTIEVTVTSVLQTTAGKMIFCRWPEALSPAPAEDPHRRPPSDVPTGTGATSERRPPTRPSPVPNGVASFRPWRGGSAGSWSRPPSSPWSPWPSPSSPSSPASSIPAAAPDAGSADSGAGSSCASDGSGSGSRGFENLPAGPAVYAANHGSALDIPIVFGHLPVDFRIIHKRSHLPRSALRPGGLGRPPHRHRPLQPLPGPPQPCRRGRAHPGRDERRDVPRGNPEPRLDRASLQAWQLRPRSRRQGAGGAGLPRRGQGGGPPRAVQPAAPGR